MFEYYILYVISVFLASAAQILLKVSADKPRKNIVREYINPHVFLGYLLMLFSMALMVAALRNMAFKFTAVLESLSYLFVPALSMLVLKEKIGKNKAAGIIIIMAGIIIFII